ncbi:MAG: NADPH-dependent F420 reductase [Asgard group archaeon]|nr:NADPH-dependent F420 reductase [Asgard group archaeon]
MEKIRKEFIIGIIPGTGKQGQGIALRLGIAGYDVLLGSRDKEKAKRIARKLNLEINKKKFQGMQNEEVAKEANLLFVVFPYEFLKASIEPLIPSIQHDTIIIDVVVPLTFEKGYASCYDDVPYNSASEFLQMLVGNKATIVGGFKTVAAKKLQQINEPFDIDIFLTSDDKQAKEKVKTLLEHLPGIRVLDAGPLIFSRTTEQMTAFVINLNKLNKLHHASFKIVSTKK